MLEIDRRLSESGLPIQLILICGKNQRLRNELRTETRALPRLIGGSTENVPYYMPVGRLPLSENRAKAA
jgi:hypothetical protein